MKSFQGNARPAVDSGQWTELWKRRGLCARDCSTDILVYARAVDEGAKVPIYPGGLRRNEPYLPGNHFTAKLSHAETRRRRGEKVGRVSQKPPPDFNHEPHETSRIG